MLPASGCHAEQGGWGAKADGPAPCAVRQPRSRTHALRPRRGPVALYPCYFFPAKKKKASSGLPASWSDIFYFKKMH